MENYASGSWEELSGIVGIDEHLNYVQSLINRYSWSDSERQQLQAGVERIREKQQDDKLNISVIGEFSTGKSSFINAMLRMPLLSSAMLQGTTLAATVIEYASDYRITLKTVDGKEETKKCGGIEKLKSWLVGLTTNPKSARLYRSITVGLPAAALKNGFRVIDTPGTNALESWHEEITVRAIEELSDISVILINATQPMPESLCTFVTANLDTVLERCVFVVTMMDLLPEKEQKKMMSFIEARIKQRFGIKEPTILVYVSPLVLKDAENPVPTQERPPLLAESYINEGRLLYHTGKYRVVSQVRKLITLIDSIYSDISQRMTNMSAGLESQLAQLLRTRQTDLKTFISGQISDRQNEFVSDCEPVLSRSRSSFQGMSGAAVKQIINSVDELNNTDALKKFVDTRLAEMCSERANNFADKLNEHSAGLVSVFQHHMELFQWYFKERFKDLEVLGISVNMSGNFQVAAPQIDTAAFQLASNAAGQAQKSENLRMGWGAAIGALIGNAVLPGIGGIVMGLFLGGMTGSASSKKMEKAKEEVKTNLGPPVRTYFNDMTDTVMSALEKYRDQLKDKIRQEINEYYRAYNKIVESRILQETKNRQEIEDKIRIIKADIAEIKSRKDQLNLDGQKIDGR